jgi:hypothetical protein
MIERFEYTRPGFLVTRQENIVGTTWIVRGSSLPRNLGGTGNNVFIAYKGDGVYRCVDAKGQSHLFHDLVTGLTNAPGDLKRLATRVRKDQRADGQACNTTAAVV